MSRRGIYRSIHSSLPDDPEFQSLSTEAIALFYTLRVCKEHGASGIFRYYIEPMARRSHMTVKQAAQALAELAVVKPGNTHGWIAYDPAVLWVVNGLRHDPHVSLANTNHLKTITLELSQLPHSQIVLKYCDYYKLPYPFATHCSTHALPSLIKEKEKEKEEEKEKEKDVCSDQPPEAVAATPPTTPQAELDPGLKAILAECPHLSLVSNGASSEFWDQVLGACEPYPMADSRWLGAKLRAWNGWFAANPHRRSVQRKKLEQRLFTWLVKDLEKIARTA